MNNYNWLINRTFIKASCDFHYYNITLKNTSTNNNNNHKLLAVLHGPHLWEPRHYTNGWHVLGLTKQEEWEKIHGGGRGDKERIKAPEVNCGCHTSFHTVQIPKCWTQVGDYDTAVPCENPVTWLFPTTFQRQGRASRNEDVNPRQLLVSKTHSLRR